MGLQQWLLLLLLAFLWGCSFFFVEIALVDIPPLTLVALRLLFGAGALHIILLAQKQYMSIQPRMLVMFLFIALVNNVIPFSLITYGQVHISGSLASIYNAAIPLSTIVIAHFFTSDEKIHAIKLVGVVIGFSGVGIMLYDDNLLAESSTLLGQLAVLAATASYGVATVFGRKFSSKGMSPLPVATGQVTLAALMFTPVAVVTEQPWQIVHASTNAWLAVGAVGIFSTACAYIIYFSLLQSSGSSRVSLVAFLIPVSAITLGIFVLDERLSANHIVGALLIAISLILIDNGLIQKWRRSAFATNWNKKIVDR